MKIMLAVIILPQSDIHWQATCMFDVWGRRNKRRLQRCFASTVGEDSLGYSIRLYIPISMQTSTSRQDILHQVTQSLYE